MAKGRLLVVEDEDLVRWSVVERLRKAGYELEEAANGADAVKAAKRTPYDLALLDMRLPDTTGLNVMKELLKLQPEIQVLIMTAYSSVDTAVEAMKLGAFDYLSKPFNLDELALTVDRALENVHLRREVKTLRKSVRQRFSLDNIVASSKAMKQILSLVTKIAASEAGTILLRGESGTGKDLVAHTLHYESRRADAPLMNITCTALQETLLESELFGHEKGSFTDAKAQKKGLFELADGGTVFLDEIGDMSPGLQGKLLRFLESKTFRRVGGTEDIRVDVRVVAATNRVLEDLMKAGKFREDLYYRLNVMPIDIPPLREREEDILALVDHFVDHFNAEFRKEVKGLSPEAEETLTRYAWPGNVRELRNVIERAMLLTAGDTIQPEELMIRTGDLKPAAKNFQLPADGISIEEVEKSLVLQALDRAGGNQSRAARLLGLTRDQVRYRMKQYGLLDKPAATGS